MAEADLLAERDAFGLLNQQRVGAAVDGVAVDLFAEDHAAGTGRALEHDEGGAVQRQLVRGRQPGDAPADDDGVNGRHTDKRDVSVGAGLQTVPRGTTSKAVPYRYMKIVSCLCGALRALRLIVAAVIASLAPDPRASR